MNLINTIILFTLCVSTNFAQELNSERKSASTYTIDKNTALYSSYPFSDSMSFVAAKKGLIAPLPNNGIVKNKKGEISWDMQAFSKFINEQTKSPASVNPSLWRQSQLLMISGLFEVVPGVYQVRGADLSNMTIIEGDKGITIYDPLITTECSSYALELYL